MFLNERMSQQESMMQIDLSILGICDVTLLQVHESESVEADSILCSEVPAALHRIHPQYGPDAVKEFADIMVEKLYTKAGQSRTFSTEAVATGSILPYFL